LSKSKNKILAKKQLLSLLKKYNYVKQHVADSQDVHEKTVRGWCRKYGIDVDFERRKHILEYEPVNVLPKDVAKKSPLSDEHTHVLPESGTEENRRNFVFSDTQIPYHNKKSLSIAIQRCRDFLGKFKGQTYCTIIGDFMDYKPLMGKDKQRRPTLQTDELKELDLEFIEAAKILEEIEKVLPKNCTKIFLKGNHEDRADKIIEKPDGIYWKRHIDIDERLGLTASNWKVFKYNESWKLGHLHYTHGAFFGKHHAWQHAQHWCKNVIYGHCFDDKTEILTGRGWINGLELEESDIVATLNIKSKELEYNDINKIYVYDHYKELYEIGSRNVSLAVTDEHGLIDVGTENNKVELFKVNEFNNSQCRTFLNGGIIKRKGISLSDDLIRLVVWIAADGSVENYYLARLHFKKERKIKRLSALLDRLGVTYNLVSYKDDTKRFSFNLKQSATKVISDVILKPFPRIFSYVNCDQATVILEEYSHTDGCSVGNGRYQISTAKSEEADLLQEIFVTNGFRCNKTKGKTTYTLAVHTGKITSPLRAHKNIKKIPYDGKVWCVSVNNGTLLVRRNGKVCVTQNTHQIQVFTMSSPVRELPVWSGSIGCLADVSPEWHRNKPNSHEHAFAEVSYIGEDFFPVIHRIIKGKLVVGGKVYKA